ncbi:MarR family transcriptional regulator [Fructobacillus ficulneus]|uniref:Transcriptional regulator, MarR family n=1 Tax=Fructobacillus ficulneus TaxID=157463 RepID=A0A0K8MH23_9LACO|nr:MarR family transcriptional regulator [Fructobacillus ficulneus]GAO99458.1 transcriptional regulator, MarR family [Fructobacillus ficulneus]
MQIDPKLATIFFAYQEFSGLVDLGEYGLTKNQHRILFIVSALDDINIKKILILLGISKQAANVAIRDLQDRGLVDEQQSEVDKRIKYLHLTKAGQKLNQEVGQDQEATLNQYFAAADGDWQGAMEKLAQKYLSQLE